MNDDHDDAERGSTNTAAHDWRHLIEVAKLRAVGARRVAVVADEAARDAAVRAFNLHTLDAARLEGAFSPIGSDGWRFDGTLHATGAQRCVVTLEPAPFDIEDAVARKWSASAAPADPLAEVAYDSRARETRVGVEEPDEARIELEQADLDEEEVESLVDPIDLGAVALEALSLALPPYPRAPDAVLETARAAPPGVKPLDDDDVKPFAGLKALIERESDN